MTPLHSSARFLVALALFPGSLAAQAPTADPPPVPLTAPALLEDRAPDPGTVEFTLVAAPAKLSLIPGNESAAYAYNGTVPGPTIEAREGDRVVITVRNELPEETTVHWHGLHIPWIADGSPFHPIQPGEEATFEFTLHPGSAGTYWYHPHPHHKTRIQVAKGLYGALIVRDDDDPLEHVPEKLILLSDARFAEDGSIDVPDRSTMQGRVDFENGYEGNVVFVNGQIRPTLDIRPGELQRWRIVNASAARVYRLAVPGHEVWHVGNDGGLFEVPRRIDEIVVANSERVELLVRGAPDAPEGAALQALPYDRYIPQTRPRDWETTRDLVALRYEGAPVDPAPEVPATLRAIPELDVADATTTRVFALTQGFINGKAMDMARVDESTTLGSTEIWQVENLVGMDHPFHLHGFSFQVIERNGEPVDFRSWEDTVNVPKHEWVRFIVRFEDYPGKWMYHCHILDHEEHGMMGILEVR